ncbi:MAG: phosphatase PAP2 family protein [Candidatus Eremiobacteraeota bacterium]|nr:phosphatase PAP2 family protein [Candidatus Eremiobacteraeota bacterium]
MEARWALASLVCFAAFFALAAIVSTRPPTRTDRLAIALRGYGVPLAILFTRLGRWYVVTFVCIAALAVTWSAGRHAVTIVAWVGLSQLLSQAVVMMFKHRLRRIRPDYWLHVQEADTSCPSGHSVTGLVFYATLASLAAASPALPHAVAVVAVVALAICAVGLPWSRLALGAHYFTDVVCGLLFGAGWAFALYALALRAGAVPS